MKKSYKEPSMPDETNTTAKHRQNTPKKWGGAFNAYSLTLDRMLKNNKPALLILGVTLVLSLIGLAVQPENNGTNQRYFVYTDLLYFVFLLAVPTYALAIADNKQMTAKEAMRFNFAKYLSVFVAFILTALIVVGSLLLLIIPAIWTIAWFYLTAYAVVDKNLGPIAALKESKRLAAAHKGKVWGLIGVSVVLSIGANVLGYLPLIGDLAAMAVSLWIATTAALLYRWLQKQEKQA
jgi:uncharacterized membrane protein